MIEHDADIAEIMAELADLQDANNIVIDDIYETNEQGERVLVKSVSCDKRAFLRFGNRTGRPIYVWWRDYEGRKFRYMRLEPGVACSVDTFLSHPWEFSDAATDEKYVICNRTVFRPPKQIAGMKYRTNWNVTVGVRSLRHSSMMCLASALRNADAWKLDLPRNLAEELYDLIKVIESVPPLPTT